MGGVGDLSRMPAVYTPFDGMVAHVLKRFAGFGAFFAIFEVTRRVALEARCRSQATVESLNSDTTQVRTLQKYAPRTVHGILLVTGGVTAGLAYELCARPFDAMRRAIHLERLSASSDAPFKPLPSLLSAVSHKLRDEGLVSFFRNPTKAPDDTPVASREGLRRRLYAASRMLARLGPWGVGFLVWESLGPGIS